MDSNFRAFCSAWSIPGYSLFEDGSQYGVPFRNNFGAKTTFWQQMKELYQEIPRKWRNLECRCLLVGKNYFLSEFATKSWKCIRQIPETLSTKTWTRPLLSDVFFQVLQKSLFHFYPSKYNKILSPSGSMHIVISWWFISWYTVKTRE